MPAVAESLARALKHHEAGDLARAEVLYREIVRIDPGHIDALHLLGVAAHQKHDHQTAADLIGQAIARGGNSALYHSNLGACYRAMNRLPEAIESFREAVLLEPGFAGGHYNLAMALEAVGLKDEAAAEYRAVIRIDPTFVQALNNLGSLLASLGKGDESAECYRRAIERVPNSAELRYNLANALSRFGRREEAVHEYRESIRLNPQIAETYNNLATALHSLGRHEDALIDLAEALRLRPDYAEARANKEAIEQTLRNRTHAADEPSQPQSEIPLPVHASPEQWCNKGTRLQSEGDLERAAECFRQALRLDSACAVAHFGLGYGLLLAERYEEAAQHYEQGILVDDTNAAAWNNLGSIYLFLQAWVEAAACYESALQIDPANAKAHFNLGNVHKDQGHLSEASACYRRALYVEPDLVEAHINLGVVLTQQGRLADADSNHARAVRIRPNNAEAHFHRALNWLIMGDFANGWDEYEWRWRYDMQPREFPCSAWDGDDLRHKTILVHSEQGVGDEIMFASCLPDVLATAGQCVIECDPRLVPLFARSFPLAHVIDRPLTASDSRALGIDVQMAAGSLPGVFRRRLESFPMQRRFLAAGLERRAAWNRRYAQVGTGLKVGISWRGGGKSTTKRMRSTTLDQWEPILRLPGVHFVNLQYGDCSAELDEIRQSLGTPIHTWTDVNPLKDLDGFAAQVSELDLVISVDNATVHMAGALGVPVWNLLHYAPNWRWMLEREDSPWYPSMRLFRQPTFGDWSTVFEAVAAELPRLIVSRAAKTTPQRHALLSRCVSSSPRDVAVSAAAGPVGSPVDSQAVEERAKYEHIWKHDEYRRFSPGATAIEKVALVTTLRQYGVKTILDAGCGSGKLMWRLMHEYLGEFDVHGFDISDNCLDPCFHDIKEQVLTLGCLWNPNDFTKKYDAVVCADVMEHIPTERVPAVLENLCKATRRIAYLSISVVPDVFGPQLIGEPLHLTIRKPSWWFARLASAGFKVVSHAVGRADNGTESQLHVFATP